MVLLVSVGLAIWALRPDEVSPVAPFAVTLKAAAPDALVPTVLPTAAPMSGLSHMVPPEPELLRGAPSRQATYDAEAEPGDFVTPPNVSVEH